MSNTTQVSGHRRTGPIMIGLGMAAVFATVATAPAAAAERAPNAAVPAPKAAGPSPKAATFPFDAAASASETEFTASGPSGRGVNARLDRKALRQSLDAVVRAGMYGTYSDVWNGDAHWRGASGVADIKTKQPMKPGMEHRIGSTTKTFTAVAILQQVDQGRIDLDSPIARYLPDLIPGERGQEITVRMLLNHTSGIADYIDAAFPSNVSFPKPETAQSYDDNRFREFRPRELVKLGLDLPPTGKPGEQHVYANTNYIIAGLLLEKLTGTSAEKYITRHVIDKAGLRHTYFPRTPYIIGPHSKAYESLYGAIDPPRDYSVYNASYGGMAGALISTMEDVNRFYRALLTGRLISVEQLKQMQTTVPVPGAEKIGRVYGLGIFAQDQPCGRFWGHPGRFWGMETESWSSPDGRHQVTAGYNLTAYQRVDQTAEHPIDSAKQVHMTQALCGSVKGTPVGK